MYIYSNNPSWALATIDHYNAATILAIATHAGLELM
jgi:hypothetical protein